VILPTLVCLCGLLTLGAAGAQAAPFIAGFSPTTLATTVPSNGDVNPYGIVTVPQSVGALRRGDVLVSNFNNSQNAQGTGTTIVQIPPGDMDQNPGDAPVFAQISPKGLPGPCPGGVGLTTALAVTRSGFVIVGSLPTSDGSAKTARAGCLLVLNSSGKVVETIAGGPINGPWDMTAVDHGFFTTLYVTNVLNGTVAATRDFTQPGPIVHRGTVVRLQLLTIPGVRPFVFDEDVIGSGLPEQTDPIVLPSGSPTTPGYAAPGAQYVEPPEPLLFVVTALPAGVITYQSPPLELRAWPLAVPACESPAYRYKGQPLYVTTRPPAGSGSLETSAALTWPAVCAFAPVSFTGGQAAAQPPTQVTFACLSGTKM